MPRFTKGTPKRRQWPPGKTIPGIAAVAWAPGLARSPKHFDRIFPKPGDENLTAAAARGLVIPDG